MNCNTVIPFAAVILEIISIFVNDIIAFHASLLVSFCDEELQCFNCSALVTSAFEHSTEYAFFILLSDAVNIMVYVGSIAYCH